MNLPDQKSVSEYCQKAGTKIVAVESMVWTVNSLFPLLTPRMTATPDVLDWFWNASYNEHSENLFVPLLIGWDIHLKLLREYRASDVGPMDWGCAGIFEKPRLCLGKFAHFLRKMPRYNMVAGSWMEAEDGPQYASAQYEVVCACADDVADRKVIMVCRVQNKTLQEGWKP